MIRGLCKIYSPPARDSLSGCVICMFFLTSPAAYDILTWGSADCSAFLQVPGEQTPNGVRAMKWYEDRLKELAAAEPVYSVCGDDCAVCPRYLARSDKELRETAEFWMKAGWRDRIVSNDGIRCRGCGTRGTCSYMLLPCVQEHGVKACRECAGYPCEKIRKMLANSAMKEAQCRAACSSEREFAMLRRAFYEKEKNLAEKPCLICDLPPKEG